jgi:hypothetical protein
MTNDLPTAAPQEDMRVEPMCPDCCRPLAYAGEACPCLSDY